MTRPSLVTGSERKGRMNDIAQRHTILTVTVGSHLHGTVVEGSDFDQRSVVVTPIAALLDPFAPTKAKIAQEQDDSGPRTHDHAYYELKGFAQKATRGNPTILEVLFNPLVDEATPEGTQLQRIRTSFLDSRAIKHAHTGFMLGQLRQSRAPQPNRPRGKLLSSAILGGLQAITLLKHHDVDPSKLLDGRGDYWTHSGFHRELKEEGAWCCEAADVAVCKLLGELEQLKYEAITPHYDEIRNYVLTAYMSFAVPNTVEIYG